MKSTVETKFFNYTQNNSHGRFEAPAHYVIIEAKNADEANSIAETLGLYFDGNGDCSCCGDRWYSVWSEEVGNDMPLLYGESPEKIAESSADRDSYDNVASLLIKYYDGTEKVIKKEKEGK